MIKNPFLRYLLALLVRVVRSCSEVALTLIGSEIVGFLEVNWVEIGLVCATTAVVTILTSFVSLPEFKNLSFKEVKHEPSFDVIE